MKKTDEQIILDYLGPLEHRRNCSSRDGKCCDCFAQGRNRAAEALERIVAERDRLKKELADR